MGVVCVVVKLRVFEVAFAPQEQVVSSEGKNNSRIVTVESGFRCARNTVLASEAQRGLMVTVTGGVYYEIVCCVGD